ncbi:MAG TPA: NAD(P)/FAD-dependent oxidoreductase [Ktedonobacterales bacterium]|nr:NAD(P)/FAD-dependent oxidoreductase [Ktedonobacterales bacterium]
MYDAIVLGARVAGSPTAMLLARKGYKVLLVDRATFPSDTLSTHQVQIYGGVRLRRWGLLDAVRATNCPPAHRVTFDVGPVILHGEFPTLDGVGAVHSPRRTVLDKILVDAARAADAEVRENFNVEEILMEGGRVTGIRGKDKGRRSVTETARIVIGADGQHSRLARAVQAATYHTKPALSCGYYTYFSGVPLNGGEIYSRDRRAIGAWPTNDGLTLIYVAWPIAEFHTVRADIEGNFLQTLDLAPSLAQRVRQGKRAERLMGSADFANFYRKPYGSGWALVGDAGYHKDPITGLGISDAFRDAELLADAIDAGFSGGQPMDTALAGYEKQRNAASEPMYEFTTQLASFAPPMPEQHVLFEALHRNQQATNQFFGVLTGAVPYQEFFAPNNLFRVIGPGGMAKIAWRKTWLGLRSAGQRKLSLQSTSDANAATSISGGR